MPTSDPQTTSAGDNPGPSGSSSGTDSVCVLWHDPSRTPPRELIRSLSRHGATVISCSDAYAALAESVVALRTAGEGAAPRAVLVLLVEPARLSSPGPAAFLASVRRYVPRSACWWFSDYASPSFRAVTPQDVQSWEAAAAEAAREAPRGDEHRTADTRPAFGADPTAPELRSTDRARPAWPTGASASSEPNDGPRLRLAPESEPAAPHRPEVLPEPKRPAPGLAGSAAEAPPPATAPHPGSILTAEELTMLLGEPNWTISTVSPPPPSPSHPRP